VFAVRTGRVRVHAGERCGVGVTLVGDDGFSYLYCHLALAAVKTGSRVAAADVLGLSGDSGNARGVPHLHFQVRDRAGRSRCPQRMLLAWYGGADVPSTAAPVAGCWFPRDRAA